MGAPTSRRAPNWHSRLSDGDSFAASAAYLACGSDGANSLARGAGDCAVAFGGVMLVSGMIWAKRAWGIWWTWDPQLTTARLEAALGPSSPP